MHGQAVIMQMKVEITFLLCQHGTVHITGWDGLSAGTIINVCTETLRSFTGAKSVAPCIIAVQSVGHYTGCYVHIKHFLSTADEQNQQSYQIAGMQERLIQIRARFETPIFFSLIHVPQSNSAIRCGRMSHEPSQPVM